MGTLIILTGGVIAWHKLLTIPSYTGDECSFNDKECLHVLVILAVIMILIFNIEFFEQLLGNKK